MDAVGYHPYLYDVTTMEQDTLALRQWLDTNGHAASRSTSTSSARRLLRHRDWGAKSRHIPSGRCVRRRSTSRTSRHSGGVISLADTDTWFPMVGSERSETPLGTAYLGEVQALTTQGCPATVASTPPAATHPATIRRRPHEAKEKRPQGRQDGQGVPTTSPVAASAQGRISAEAPQPLRKRGDREQSRWPWKLSAIAAADVSLA